MKCLRTQLQYDKFSKFTSEIVCHWLCIASMYPFLLVWLLINTVMKYSICFNFMIDTLIRVLRNTAQCYRFTNLLYMTMGWDALCQTIFTVIILITQVPFREHVGNQWPKKKNTKENILYWCFRERIFKDFQISQLFK